MKKTILSTTLGLAICSSLIAGPVEDIAKKHAEAKATELEAYLKANPKAEDKDEAVNHLLAAYGLTENTERATALLQERFDALESGANVNVQMLYVTTQSLFAIYADTGNKDAARKLIDTATQKSEGHKAGAQLARAFGQLEKKLNQPGKGDTMEIKFTSLDGKEVDLAAMKGKVVLVDFWATWCGPCIAELPHVTKTYEKYRDQGFEIIGISLDKEADKDKLVNFVKDKNMTWHQQFDGKGWGNEIAQKFGISSIPATFLIGKDGTVVATNLRGEALEKTVGEHLAK